MTEDVVTRQKTRVGTPAELAASREARGMSQIDISRRIKLQVRQVVALEEGQWDALPGRAFVRGALRSYGRLLDVDVGPLLESIGGFAEPSQVSVMQPLDASSSRSHGRGFNGGGRASPMLWVVAGLIGVVAVVVYFGSGEDAARIRSWLPDVGRPADGAANTAPAASPPTVAGSPSAPTGSGPAASTAPADAAGQGMP
ncbi:MAG: helix-turn-helix domain-containing protein, partial [Lautropia sp.]|nr:helix-turn-helix domain-containing protein [Lautropia sp.]